ncbi:MFS multidrug transporter [Metarhizium brunneum]
MTHKVFGWLIALALSEGVWGGPTQLPSGSRITIGYRRVHPNQAAKYKEAGTLTDDPITGHTQIGEGVYLTAGYGQWEGHAGDVDCAVTADEEEFRKVPKVILPDEQLLDTTHEEIDAYIKSQDSSWDPLKTIRISHIPKYGDGTVAQMAIPQALLNSRGGSLQIQVDCEDAQGPTVDYGQWENTKGDTSIMPARADSNKIFDLSNELDASRDLVEQVSSPEHVAQLELRATNAMYTAREGVRHYVKTAEECKGDRVLKGLCKDQIKYYLQDRQAYARFLIRAAERSFEMLTTPLNAVIDDAARQRAIQALQEWATRLQRQVDARAKNLEALKKGEPVKGLDDPKERDIEKTALKRELKAMKKKLSKLVDKAATFGAKEEQGSVPPKEGQKQTKLQQLGEWLQKNKNRFFPSGDGDKDDYEPTASKDDKDPSRREACVKEQYGGDASQAFETAYTVIEERDDEDRICPERQEGAAACAAAKFKGDGQAAFSDAYQLLKAIDSLELVCPPPDTAGDAPGGSSPAEDLAGLRSEGWRLFVQQALGLGYTRERLVHILDRGVGLLQLDNPRLYDLLRQHPAAFNVLLGLRRDGVRLSSCLPDGRLQRRANGAGQSSDHCEIVRAMTSGKQVGNATPNDDGKQPPTKQEPPKEPENKFHDQVKKLQHVSSGDGSWTGGILGAFFAGPLFAGSILATSPEVVALIGELGASLGLAGTAAGSFSESSAVGGALSAVRSAAARSVGSVLRRTIGRLNYLAHRGINPVVRRILSDAVRAGTRAAEREPLLRAGSLVH